MNTEFYAQQLVDLGSALVREAAETTLSQPQGDAFTGIMPAFTAIRQAIALLRKNGGAR